MAHRYLWGPATDELLADEAVDCGADQTPGTTDDVRWTLGDHLNSVRDWAVYDDQGTATLADDTVTIVKHVVYDAFGNVIDDWAPGVESLLLYTARPFDADTHLQNNLNRWYDATIGCWLSVDPWESDPNPHRYCRDQHGNENPPIFRNCLSCRANANRDFCPRCKGPFEPVGIAAEAAD